MKMKMKGKRAFLVINPHAGQNVTSLPDLVAVFAAASWRTDIAIKGVASQPGKQHRYIIAGTVPHQLTGDTTPVAVLVNDGVTIFRCSGEQVAPSLVQQLQEGGVIVADGKKSKYGVIRARHILM